ncbi:MAG: hypothetical protein H7A51_12630 [Akkermansiaceae bacterium]|nr:hypothetical protein [Akkermansiaceae bacterium]
MRMLIAVCILCSPVLAKEVFPTFVSADGKQTMRARPVAVDAGKIKFEREDGSAFVAGPDKFSEKDQKQLRAWADAMKNHAHAALIARVQAAETLRVLFVGNSYSFQIPKAFENLAKAEGKKIHVEQVTKGGWTLAKHASAQATLDKIARGKWDVVVLQEQSQLPAFQEPQRSQQMDAPARQLADAVRTADAIPVFFLTWGRKDGDRQNAAVFPDDTYEAMQKRLASGYRKTAAHAGGAYVVPVGEAWSMLHQMKKDDGLYAADGSHPAKRGNYLGACVFYSSLYDAKVTQSARDIPDAETIRRAAASARLAPLPYPLHR